MFLNNPTKFRSFDKFFGTFFVVWWGGGRCPLCSPSSYATGTNVSFIGKCLHMCQKNTSMRRIRHSLRTRKGMQFGDTTTVPVMRVAEKTVISLQRRLVGLFSNLGQDMHV